jgi:hypothetical protein
MVTFSYKYKNILTLILILICGFYAGLTSRIFGGLRVYDILLLCGILILLLKKEQVLPLNAIWGLGALLFVFLISTVLAYFNRNEFIMSGIREWLILILSFLFGFLLAQRLEIINISITFNYSVALISFIYILIYFLPEFGYYYAEVDNLASKKDYLGRIQGPSIIITVYLYIILIRTNYRVLSISFRFFLFSLIVFGFTQSRQNLVIMLSVLFLGVFFSKYRKYSYVLLVFTIISCLVFFTLFDGYAAQRIENIVSPFKDTSFLYRVLSNQEFLSEFFSSGWVNVFLGNGLGASYSIYLGDFIGTVKLVILDNSILTLLLKTGLIGTTIFYGALIFNSTKVYNVDRFLIWLPIIIATLLSAHVVTNPTFVMAFAFAIHFLRRHYKQYETNIIYYN